MDALLRRLADWAHLTQLGPLAKSALSGLLIYGAFLAVVFVLERRAGVPDARYRTRTFANDVAYTLFYKGGFYALLVLAAVTNAFQERLAFFQLDLLRHVPWPVGLFLFWVLGDFVTYWWHRFQHANRFLWAFHSVHHSQQQLTLFSASRRHVLEELSMDVLLYFVLFHMVLGIPTRGWMPLGVFITCLAAIQHAQLDWGFGPLGRVFVSPRFHAYHHSVEQRHANVNFAFLFSVWDHLFGTAVVEPGRPQRYGAEGIDMNEGVASHLFNPFRLAWRWRRGVTEKPTGAP